MTVHLPFTLMKESPFWTEVYSIENQTVSPELPAACDVAIIGGGLTGLSTALHLARQGACVVIFEKETIGWGASTRNAGMALTGLKPIPEELFDTYGAAFAKRLYQTSLDAIDFAEKFLTAESIDCDFQRCGALWAAVKPSHYHSFKASQDFMRAQLGHETELVPPEDMRRELGTPFYCGGLLDPLSAGLNPAKLVAGLALSARHASVTILEHTAVENFERRGNGFELITARGRVKARELVCATNGYTPDAFGYFQRRVMPIGSYIIVTEPLGKALAAELLPNNRMAFDTKNFLFYFRRTPDERLLFGGRTSFVPITDKQSAAILTRAMRTVFPQLASATVDYSWHGNVGYPFDHLPHLGVHDGIHYAMGFCGHGVVMTLYFGYQLARFMNGDAGDSPFFELKFPAKFFFRRRPWFLPLAGGYYKIKDWIS